VFDFESTNNLINQASLKFKASRAGGACVCFVQKASPLRRALYTQSSCVLQGKKASGAFILTASHNPGGPHEVSLTCAHLVPLANPTYQFVSAFSD
jgi:hypothetical protein